MRSRRRCSETWASNYSRSRQLRPVRISTRTGTRRGCAFSIACPAVLPVRIYQVLFAGYWFWGNFLNPRAFPTIAGSVLTASAQFAAEAFFGARFGSGGRVTVPFVILNLCVLAACAVAALAAVTKYLDWQARRQ